MLYTFYTFTLKKKNKTLFLHIKALKLFRKKYCLERRSCIFPIFSNKVSIATQVVE